MSRKPNPRTEAAASERSSGADLPRVTRALVAQDESRRLLEDVVSPWRVTRWDQNDFGIDAAVEIAAPVRDSADHQASGRLFAIQLKSTDALEMPSALSVTTRHLRYWLNHSLPVLLVSAHLPSRTLHARWIDAELLGELRLRTPTFWSQQTVTVALGPHELAPTAKEALEAAVLRFRRRELAMPPSRFFALRERVLAAASRLQEIGNRSGVKSVEILATETRATMRASAYAVAIAGPQRVGKSTLVNALLGADVSPVADYPTTAVPLLFDAGEKAEATVVFADSSESRVESTSDALRPYAAQQENDSNDKNVKLVRVVLPNDMLARGVSLIDTPGLHDANKAVRDVTAAALHHADAVLYVLDASLGGKFKLGQAEVEDLLDLQTSKERVLVVLNQADALSDEEQARLYKYAEKELRKHGLWNGMPVQPMFVSGRAAWEARRVGEKPPDSFARLEDELWGHLLRHRATGFHRLAAGVGSLREACETATALLSDRAVKGAESGQIDRARATCAAAAEEAAAEEHEWRLGVRNGVRHFLRERGTTRVAVLRAELSAIPVKGALPASSAVEKRLQAEVHEDAQAVLAFVRDQIALLAAQQGQLVRSALADSRARLGIPIAITAATPSPTIPAVDLSLPEAHLGFWSGLLGFLVNPLVGVAATFLGWAIGHDVAVGRRRARVVSGLSARYDRALGSAYGHLVRQTDERTASAGQSIVMQARGRLETFISDAERRIQRLGSPLDLGEAERIRLAVADFEQECRQLDLVAAELARVNEDIQ